MLERVLFCSGAPVHSWLRESLKDPCTDLIQDDLQRELLDAVRSYYQQTSSSESASVLH